MGKLMWRTVNTTIIYILFQNKLVNFDIFYVNRLWFEYNAQMLLFLQNMGNVCLFNSHGLSILVTVVNIGSVIFFYYVCKAEDF